MSAVRPMPHNLDAERSILGGILLDGSAINDAAKTITSADFYVETHRKVFEAMLSLSADGIPIDRVTVKERLSDLGTLAQAGGEDAIDVLDKIVPSASNIGFYASAVKKKSVARRVIIEARAVALRAHEQGNVDEILADAAE